MIDWTIKHQMEIHSIIETISEQFNQLGYQDKWALSIWYIYSCMRQMFKTREYVVCCHAYNLYLFLILQFMILYCLLCFVCIFVQIHFGFGIPLKTYMWFSNWFIWITSHNKQQTVLYNYHTRTFILTNHQSSHHTTKKRINILLHSFSRSRNNHTREKWFELMMNTLLIHFHSLVTLVDGNINHKFLPIILQ